MLYDIYITLAARELKGTLFLFSTLDYFELLSVSKVLKELASPDDLSIADCPGCYGNYVHKTVWK